jgi:hypothetical protein
MNAYLNILQTLVPLYLIIILGYAAGAALWRCGATGQSVPKPKVLTPRPRRAGRFKMADDFVLDRLNSFNAKVRRCSSLRTTSQARRVCALKPPPRCVVASSRCPGFCIATSRPRTCTVRTGAS